MDATQLSCYPWGVDVVSKSDLQHIQMDVTQLSYYHGCDEVSRCDFNHMQSINPTCLLPWGVKCMVNINIIAKGHLRNVYACEQISKALKMDGICQFFLLDVPCLTCM
jgi:hypothetical protein